MPTPILAAVAFEDVVVFCEDHEWSFFVKVEALC
jgi:hypothetical protein